MTFQNFDARDAGGSDFAFSLEELGLIDCPAPEAFDAITRTANRLMHTPVALVSIVEETRDRQFFASQQGLGEPWASARQTPLSHSFCQHVKASGRPFVVEDARALPMVCGNLAIRDLDVVAYLGVPVRGPDGAVLGALCVIDSAPRVWKPGDPAMLEDLAACVNGEILLRANIVSNARAEARVRRYSAMREAVARAFMAPELTMEERFVEVLCAGCQAMGLDGGMIAQVSFDQARPLFQFGREYPANMPGALPLKGMLCRPVIAEARQIARQSSLPDQPLEGRVLSGPAAAAYVGVPLMLDGALYGVLEFYAREARASKWTEEELSIVKMVGLLVCAHLGALGQIAELKGAQAALIRDALGRRA